MSFHVKILMLKVWFPETKFFRSNALAYCKIYFCQARLGNFFVQRKIKRFGQMFCSKNKQKKKKKMRAVKMWRPFKASDDDYDQKGLEFTLASFRECSILWLGRIGLSKYRNCYALGQHPVDQSSTAYWWPPVRPDGSFNIWIFPTIKIDDQSRLKILSNTKPKLSQT